MLGCCHPPVCAEAEGAAICHLFGWRDDEVVVVFAGVAHKRRCSSPPFSLQDILAKLDQLELNGGDAAAPPPNGLSAAAAAAAAAPVAAAPDLLGFGEEEEPSVAAGEPAVAAYAAEDAFGGAFGEAEPEGFAEQGFAEQGFPPEAEAEPYPAAAAEAEDEGDVFADAAPPPPQQAAAPPPLPPAAAGGSGLTPEEEALLEEDDDLMGDDLGVDEADLEDGGEPSAFVASLVCPALF